MEIEDPGVVTMDPLQLCMLRVYWGVLSIVYIVESAFRVHSECIGVCWGTLNIIKGLLGHPGHCACCQGTNGGGFLALYVVEGLLRHPVYYGWIIYIVKGSQGIMYIIKGLLAGPG